MKREFLGLQISGCNRAQQVNELLSMTRKRGIVFFFIACYTVYSVSRKNIIIIAIVVTVIVNFSIARLPLAIFLRILTIPMRLGRQN